LPHFASAHFHRFLPRLYARQETDRPTPGLKPKGWADKKIDPNLYKIAGAKFGGKFIGGMIAPDPQQKLAVLLWVFESSFRAYAVSSLRGRKLELMNSEIPQGNTVENSGKQNPEMGFKSPPEQRRKSGAPQFATVFATF
jgi:hypothetical protein